MLGVEGPVDGLLSDDGDPQVDEWVTSRRTRKDPITEASLEEEPGEASETVTQFSSALYGELTMCPEGVPSAILQTVELRLVMSPREPRTVQSERSYAKQNFKAPLAKGVA